MRIFSGIGLGLAAWLAAAPLGLAITPEDKADVWLVHFDEAPLAVFDGANSKSHPRLHGLKGTSRTATGKAQLDVDSRASREYRSALAEIRQERLNEAARQLGHPLEPLFVYDVVNHGVAVRLSADEARIVAQIPGVASVEPDYVSVPMTDAGPNWIKADVLWNAAGGGFRGEKRVIGIIDTGINAAHDSFKPVSGGFAIENPRGRQYGLCASNTTAGCNNKLIGIYDLTTGEGDKEANDGLDKGGHGTHVSSIAAGNPTTIRLQSGTYAISGVAPRANLISYKACEEESKCRGSWTLAALNQAVADRVDVINYSIGGDARNPWNSSDMQAMLNAREAGTVVVVAAGNEGPEAGTVTSPGNAPWVIGVANTTHDRGNVAKVRLSGGTNPLPGGGVLYGASLTKQPIGPATLVYAGNYGSALCATGPNVDAMPPDISTSPWSANTFTGQIVICDRGIYARVMKGYNVKNAGGSGMLLLNSAAEGASLVADEHQLPATHLSYADGVALKQWLSQGSDHKAEIEASSIQYLSSFADVLATSSGRGPVNGDWLKPNVAAPGSNILAAYKDNNNSYAYMTGTSMASPHVAGAAALLKQAHPNWGPAEIESALQTTARASVRLPDGTTPAGVLDAGAGVVNLATATRAGLVFPVSGAEFRAADPGRGGLPSALNLAALVSQNCVDTCRFERTVKNVSGASATWNVSVNMPGGTLRVTPAQFTLNNAASQKLEFTFDVGAEANFGQWNEGTVTLSRSGATVPPTVIPVAIRPSAGNLPNVVVLSDNATSTAVSESGWMDVPFQGLTAMPNARFSASDLIEPLQAEPTIPQDPTNDEIYDDLGPAQEGVSVFRLQARHSGRARLRVEARSATAVDIDLFVGRGNSATATPSKGTEICRSSTPQANEVCDREINVLEGEYFWVLVQNWKASSAGQDKVTLQAALVPLEPTKAPAMQRTLHATGPGHLNSKEAFTVRAAWNDPTLQPGDTRWGHLLLGATASNPTGVGSVLVKLTRSTTVQHAAALLHPDTPRVMQLKAGHAQDRLYIDVPANATGLTVKAQGSDKVKLYLAHDAAPSSPGIIAAPPRNAAQAVSSGQGGVVQANLTGAALKPGRWYVTPVNTGEASARFTLTASLSYGSGTLPRPQWGNWYTPERSGSGFFLTPASNGAAWALSWYTYRQDGTPTWYVGSTAAPGAGQSIVNVEMYRVSWDGQQAHSVVVGNVSLRLIDDNTMWANWQLDGESGAQPLQRLYANGCSALPGGNRKPDGNWYTPAKSGFGYEVLVFPGLETYIGYVYDKQGFPRWFNAHREQNAVLGTSHEMTANVLKGACPSCTYVATTSEAAGTFRRKYTSATQGRMGATITAPAPHNINWSVEEDVNLLTTPIECQ